MSLDELDRQIVDLLVQDDTATRRDVEAVVDLRLASESDRRRFERAVAESDAIVEAVHLTGVWDYQLRLACTATAQIDAVIRRLKEAGGVRDTQTRVVLDRLVGAPPAR